MSLIIKNKIAQLKKGYPTVSDKYNVQGGVYEGDEGLYFGDLVAYGSATGHYVGFAEAADKASEPLTVADVAGICLATNVKLVNRYPGDTENVETVKGEAFNLLVRGFVAVALKDSTALTTAKAALVTAEAMPETTQEQKEAKAKAIKDAKEDIADAIADMIADAKEGAQVGIDLTTGEFTTDTTNALPGTYFMGVAEAKGDIVLAEINYRM